MVKTASHEFKAAANDFYLLLNRGYASRPALKLVGDRYRLNGSQRKVLYRGISPADKAAERRKKRVIDLALIKTRKLHIDGYNVLFTVMNFLLGKDVFIANDGVIRDVGDYAGIEQPTVLNQAIDAVISCIGYVNPESVIIYLDGPVPGSREHAHILTDAIGELDINGRIHRVKEQKADEILKREAQAGDVIATSDSEIMDAVPCQLADLSRFVLEQRYSAEFVNLERVLQSLG